MERPIRIFENESYCPYKTTAYHVLNKAVEDLRDLRLSRLRHRDSAYHFWIGGRSSTLAFWCKVLGVSRAYHQKGMLKDLIRYDNDEKKRLREQRNRGRRAR